MTYQPPKNGMFSETLFLSVGDKYIDPGLRDRSARQHPLEKPELMHRFELNDQSFNHQVYFMMIHMWLLHQRFVLEGSKVVCIIYIAILTWV